VVVSDDFRDGSTYTLRGKRLSTGAEFTVPRTSTYNAYPAIWGNRIVYSDRARTYLYDLGNGSITPISDTNSTMPDIYGDVVVWGTLTNVYGKNLTSGETIIMRTAKHIYGGTGPKIRGNTVVWTEDPSTSDRNIYAYNISTGQCFPVFSDALYRTYPVTNGEIVAWIQQGEHPGLYAKSLGTQETFLITSAVDQYVPPAIYGDVIVYVGNAQSGRALYGYHLSSRSEFPICLATVYGQFDTPAIWENLVVWADFRGGSGDIYGAIIPEPAALAILALGSVALAARRRRAWTA
jgi:beta propeller repeat protein